MIDTTALRSALMIGVFYYTFCTYWFSGVLLVWQTLCRIVLSQQQREKFHIPESIILPRLQFWTQSKLRTFVLLTGGIYLLVARFGTDIQTPLCTLILTAGLIGVIIQGMAIAIFNYGRWQTILFETVNITALILIIQSVLSF
ncbi:MULTISPECIES: hypothetical protein [Vibrio harveyi group]|uniref:hypothetical protein n=1 Tax=Vibrio harveyi group TaxID=717610 RepID=UPI000A367864|nr:hypothetical protein [Vibrio parahaemolyticus]MBY7720062.1 hypothetical protein [Vibrio parahaemolyticus]MCZ6377005.1 hypothetical protein [Vibrio parahaemolyticus]MDF4661927.1 hypothetical protein [Vibrio parahaemolyticus]MDF4906440.1 hypothetical protein [Vibrio parahaemolyticus]MDG3418680.1 hypothetical protein [Vibrio parahaemolyticus]